MPTTQTQTYKYLEAAVDGSRRLWFFWLVAGWFALIVLTGTALAQESQTRVIEVRIENRTVVANSPVIRITEGETVELRWISDEAVDLHLHGYDIEINVRPSSAIVTVIEARATGRFPITSHGWGGGGGGHTTLIYLEVYPN